MMEIQLKVQKPLKDLVYLELKHKILTGEIVSQTRLMEIDLSEKMNVSRTPIREAIKRLADDGLVKVEPRRGAYASMISTEDMVEILEVRQDLEGLAAFFAADRMTEEQMEELKYVSGCYDDAVKRGNMEEMIKHDTRFHHIIVESCRNKILVQMIEQLQELVLRFRYIYYDNFRRAENMPEEHAAIVAAIAEGDADKARAAADIHIERLKELVMKEGVQQRHV